MRPLGGPLAVRSSAVDEDGAEASFAGQHLTLLNVPSADAVGAALREVWWSANSDSAITYRQRVGLFTRPSVGVVVQALLDPESAGVMFTRNPINGADERVIEASWGLGEAVVAGLVIPDHFRIDRSGQVLERSAGAQADRDPDAAGRRHRRGARSPPSRAEQLCLDDDQLAALHRLAARCEEVYGPERDIEWAFADGAALPAPVPGDHARSRREPPRPKAAAPADARAQHRGSSPTSTGASSSKIAALFKERRFAAGETVIKEGSGGAAFYVIESGEATVTIGGEPRGDAARRATTSARSR